MKILNFGSLNIDNTYVLEHFVKSGETISSDVLYKNCGGKGLNQSVAMSKAGLDVYHAGMIGKSDGDVLLEALKSYNIHTDYIKAVDAKSGHAIIQVTKSGENCIILYSGANKKITPEYIDEVLSHFDSGDFCVLQNEISCLPTIIDRAYEKGLRIILNPSPCDEALLCCPLHKVEYFLLNEIEGEQLTNERSPDKIISKLCTRFPNSKFLLTLGKHGVSYYDGTCTTSFGIYEVSTVDTTAAGDTFTGYFIHSIINNVDVATALTRASAAASITVSRKGAAQSIPYRQEVDDFILTHPQPPSSGTTI